MLCLYTQAVSGQVRSDDLELHAKFRGLTMSDLAELDLRAKSRWFRHFIEQFIVPAEAEQGPIRLEIRRTGN